MKSQKGQKAKGGREKPARINSLSCGLLAENRLKFAYIKV